MLTAKTGAKTELIDVRADVQQAVRSLEISDGTCMVITIDRANVAANSDRNMTNARPLRIRTQKTGLTSSMAR